VRGIRSPHISRPVSFSRHFYPLVLAITAWDNGVNHDVVLAALSDNKEEALSMKEMAKAIGLDISTHTD
jgi:hypothetical protein